MNAPDPWHYPRPELAQRYLDMFALGLTAARGLFAKRRFGKSQFLEKDLIPAAAAQGYRTAYVNLWDNREQPAAALLEALTPALAPRGAAKWVKRLNTPQRKLKASAKLPGLAEGSLEAELSDAAATTQTATAALTQALRAFNQPKQRLLLVLDEAQVLADAAHSNLTHALRAALDSRKANIKVVFAGSSETTLRRMFGRPSEPFYNWAPLEPFELLGTDFVHALVKRTNALSRFPLARQDALAVFEALHRTPEFFRRFLDHYITNPDLGVAAALDETRGHVFNDRMHLSYWNGLLPADREVLRLLAHGAPELHGAAARARLGLVLGLDKPVSANTPYNSLKRLQADGVVAKLDYATYRFEDDALAHWVRERGDD